MEKYRDLVYCYARISARSAACLARVDRTSRRPAKSVSRRIQPGKRFHVAIPCHKRKSKHARAPKLFENFFIHFQTQLVFKRRRFWFFPYWCILCKQLFVYLISQPSCGTLRTSATILFVWICLIVFLGFVVGNFDST